MAISTCDDDSQEQKAMAGYNLQQIHVKVYDENFNWYKPASQERVNVQIEKENKTICTATINTDGYLSLTLPNYLDDDLLRDWNDGPIYTTGLKIAVIKTFKLYEEKDSSSLMDKIIYLNKNVSYPKDGETLIRNKGWQTTTDWKRLTGCM